VCHTHLWLLRCVAACCSVLQRVAGFVSQPCVSLKCVAMCCSVLQRVAACCSVLQDSCVSLVCHSHVNDTCVYERHMCVTLHTHTHSVCAQGVIHVKRLSVNDSCVSAMTQVTNMNDTCVSLTCVSTAQECDSSHE